MSVKPIIQYPNDKIRQVAEEVSNLQEAKQIVQDLKDTLTTSKIPGAGIAAPQIGENKRIFIARRYYKSSVGERYEDIALINPKIRFLSREKQRSLEGCLSIYDVYGYVERSRKLKVEYTDLQGKTRILKASGFLSNVIQHEYDHLEGILFIDKLLDGKTYTDEEINKMVEEKK